MPSAAAASPTSGRCFDRQDFLGRRAPHTGYEQLAQAPFEEPKISAGGVPWIALPDPEAGRIRSNAAGTVVTLGSGAKRHGFALCLCCGRAEAEESDNPHDPMPSALKRHAPLAPPRGVTLLQGGHCPGGTHSQNRVQRRLRLGHETHTDAFEFQLPAGESKSAALGLVAGMREALATRLGVEVREIGVAVADSSGPFNSNRVSALLHDRAAGGAGMVTRLTEADWFEATIAGAADILDCHEGCREGCPACVLRPDLNFGDRVLDRRAALRLAERIRDRLVLPSRLRLFGPETRPVGMPAAAYIDLQRGRGNLFSLWLFLHGKPAEWDLDSWPMYGLLRDLDKSGVKVRIAIEAGIVDSMSLAHRISLHRLVPRGASEIVEMTEMPIAGDVPVLAVFEGPNGTFGLATPEADSIPPGSIWGSGSNDPVVRGPITSVDGGTPTKLEKLLSTPPGSKVLRLGGETGGPINGFGERFWKVIGKALPEFVAQMETGVEEVAYLDRYLTTPFTIRLLRETIAAVPGRTGSTLVKVSAAMNSGPRRHHGRLVYDNFPDDDMRKAAIEEAVTGDVQIMPKVAMPHERAFVLRLENRKLLRLYLDQGFGAWRSDAVVFPFGDARRRAAALTTFESKVHVGKLPSLAVLEMPKFA